MKKLIYLFLALLIVACSDDNSDDSNLFRNIYSNTFWRTDCGLVTFSPDKLFYDYCSGEGCYYWEEGSYNDVDYDACTYNNVTYVIIEEDNDTFIIRQITSSGINNFNDSPCDGFETTINFQIINENVLELTYSYISEFNDDTISFTLTKVNDSFSTNNCINGTLNGFLF